jgi:hypothetical protein
LKLCDGANNAIAKINQNRRLSGAQRTTQLRQVEIPTTMPCLRFRARALPGSLFTPSFENGTELRHKHRSGKWLQISNAEGSQVRLRVVVSKQNFGVN